MNRNAKRLSVMIVCLRSLVILALALATAGVTVGCSSKSKAEKLSEQGVLFFKHQKYYKAIERFEDSLKLEPKRVTTLLYCADAYLQTDKPKVAIERAGLALEVEPDNAHAMLAMGQGYLILARQETEQEEPPAEGDEPKASLGSEPLRKAKDLAQKLASLEPDSIETLLLEAQISLADKDYEKAEQLFEQAMAKDKKNVTAQSGLIQALIFLKKLERAEEICRQAIKDDPQPSVMIVTDLAQVLSMQDRFNEAYELLAPNLTSDNKDPQFNQFMIAGRILIRQAQALDMTAADYVLDDDQLTTGSAEEAKQQAQVIERLSQLGTAMKGFYPNRPESWFYRGISYQLQGNSEEAEKHLNKACSFAPGDTNYRMALAHVLVKKKDYALARQELRNLLKYNPSHFQARLLMAQCFSLEGQTEEAINLLNLLATEYPDNKELLQARAQVLVLSENPRLVQEGLATLERLAGEQGIRKGGKEYAMAQARYQEGKRLQARGEVATAAEQLRQSEDLFRQALAAEPANYIAHLRLAELALMRGDSISALDHVSQAAEVKPQFLPMKARLFVQLGQTSQAIAVYQQLLAQSPGAIGHLLAIAGIEYDQGKLNQSLASYDKIIEQFPDDPRAYIRKSMVLAQTDSNAKSVEFLTEIANKFPSSNEAQLMLARMLMQTGQFSEACVQFDLLSKKLGEEMTVLRSQGATPDQLNFAEEKAAPVQHEASVALMLAGQDQRAEEVAHQAVKPGRVGLASYQMLEAIAQLRLGKPDDARRTLENVALPPQVELADVVMLKALTEIADGETGEARKIMDNARTLSPVALELFGQMVDKQPADKLSKAAGDLALQVHLATKALYAQAALKVADQNLEALPDEPFVLAYKAQALGQLGRVGEALTLYDNLLKQLPQSQKIQLALVDLHQNLSARAQARGQADEVQAELAKAVELCEQVVKVSPKDLAALEKLSFLLQTQGKTEEANEYYRKVIEIDPENWKAYNNLAWNQAEAGQLDLAAQTCAKALEFAPESGGIQDTAGWIALQQGDNAKALELFQQAAKRIPNNPDIRFHLAQALAAMGQPEQAAAQLSALMQALPEYKKIDEVKAMLGQLQQ